MEIANLANSSPLKREETVGDPTKDPKKTRKFWKILTIFFFWKKKSRTRIWARGQVGGFKSVQDLGAKNHSLQEMLRHCPTLQPSCTATADAFCPPTHRQPRPPDGRLFWGRKRKRKSKMTMEKQPRGVASGVHSRRFATPVKPPFPMKNSVIFIPAILVYWRHYEIPMKVMEDNRATKLLSIAQLVLLQRIWLFLIFQRPAFRNDLCKSP